MKIIKAGFLISYDYEFIKISLPIVYDFVDEIHFAVDVDRLTWAGQPYVIDDTFWEWVRLFDKDHKVKIYEDRFYIDGLTPIECDTRERNMLGEQMGICDWYLQIDSDEYFVDFEHFVNKLRVFESQEQVTIQCNVACLFKKTPTGYLCIGESKETLCFATNNPKYDVARNNFTGNIQVYWDDLVLHQSWARTEDEIFLKLNNWGHKNDFNVQSFYNLWKATDEFNYHAIRNFHPLDSFNWPMLKLVVGSITEILDSPEIKLINFIEVPVIKRKSLLSRLWKEIKSSL